MEKIKNWIITNPKYTVSIMFLLIVISIICSMATYYKLKEQPKTIDLVKHYKETLNSTKKVANDVSKIAKITYELEAYRAKEVLTAQDSLRINYLINQINEKN